MDGDLLRNLRAATAFSHQAVEEALALTDEALDRERLSSAVTILAGFWVAAETGLDAWASMEPHNATALQWDRRRRSDRFHQDTATFGTAWPPPSPAMAEVTCVDEAIGRLYVLEGSSLGGQLINRSLAARSADDPLSLVTLQGLDPYGANTGAMWASFRRAATGLAVRPQTVVDAATETFAVLRSWCDNRVGAEL